MKTARQIVGEIVVFFDASSPTNVELGTFTRALVPEMIATTVLEVGIAEAKAAADVAVRQVIDLEGQR